MAIDFLKHTKDSLSVKQKAVKLIESYSKYQCLLANFPSLNELAIEAKELLKDSPKDPLIQSLIAYAIMFGGNDKQDDFELANSLLSKASSEIGLAKEQIKKAFEFTQDENSIKNLEERLKLFSENKIYIDEFVQK